MTLRGTQPVRARPRLFHFPTRTLVRLTQLGVKFDWHSNVLSYLTQ